MPLNRLHVHDHAPPPPVLVLLILSSTARRKPLSSASVQHHPYPSFLSFFFFFSLIFSQSLRQLVSSHGDGRHSRKGLPSHFRITPNPFQSFFFFFLLPFLFSLPLSPITGCLHLSY